MQARGAKQPLTPYLVELVPPVGGLEGIQALAARARRASDELSKEGVGVRFLRSVFVPEEGQCFLLFAGDSA